MSQDEYTVKANRVIAARRVRRPDYTQSQNIHEKLKQQNNQNNDKETGENEE